MRDDDCGHSPDLWDTCPAEYITESGGDQDRTAWARVSAGDAANRICDWLDDADVDQLAELCSRFLTDCRVTVFVQDDPSEAATYQQGRKVSA